jgi:hypothetical protein
MRKEPTRLVAPASNDGRKRTRVVTFVGPHRMACGCTYEQWLLDIPSQRLRTDCIVVVGAMYMLRECLLSTNRVDCVEKGKANLQ